MASRILLADDSITIQKVVNLTFADEGIEVVSVSNGEVAERRMGEVNPDLVLADIFMPGKNGYELCEFIKQSAQFRHVPVVLLVGAFEPFDQIEARRVRADAHLTKPFESRTLVETVRKLIAASPAPVSSPTPQAEESNSERAGQGRETQPGLRAAPDAPPVAPAPFKLDISAMTGPLESPAAPARSGAESSVGTMNESSPIDIDFAAPPRPASASSPISIAIETDWQGRDKNFFGSTAQSDQAVDSAPILEIGQPFEEPIELTGPGFQDAASAGSEFSVSFDDPGSQTAGAATGNAEQAQAWPDARAENTSEPGKSSQDVLLDFERIDAPRPPQPDNEVSFDLEMPDFDEVPTDELAESDSEEFDTQPLGSPAGGGERPQPYSSRQQSSSYNAQANQSSYASPSDDSFGMADAALNSSTAPSMLAVDEPLGDLLEDDLPAANYSTGTWQAGEAEDLPAPDEAISFDPVSLEPSVAPDVPWNRDYDLSVEADFADQTPLDLEAATESGSQSPERQDDFEIVDVMEGFKAGTDPAQATYESAPNFDILMPESEAPAQAAGQESREEMSAGSAPGADSVSQSPPDYREPDQVEQYVESVPLDGSVMTDADFTSSAMWAEEETRFATIDIEAIPVDGFDATPATPVETPDRATGAEPAAQFTVQPIEDHQLPSDRQPGAEAQATGGAQQASASLPPEVMDEIVRRVVAQISDSVVREVAWEVVPDCVERVIEKLARESLTKKP